MKKTDTIAAAERSYIIEKEKFVPVSQYFGEYWCPYQWAYQWVYSHFTGEKKYETWNETR